MAQRAAQPGAPSAAPAGHVLVGEFGRAQGLGGEVRLKSFTADPFAVASYGPLTTSAGRTVAIERVRTVSGGQPDMLVARVMGVTTREAAEALNRVRLSIPRERLPAPAEADEFYLADLVGLRAVGVDGATLGTVVAVPNYGGGDLLEVAPNAGGETLLVPFTKTFAPSLDLAAGTVTLDVSPEP